jgi:hypothetical protein
MIVIPTYVTTSSVMLYVIFRYTGASLDGVLFLLIASQTALLLCYL